MGDFRNLGFMIPVRFPQVFQQSNLTVKAKSYDCRASCLSGVSPLMLSEAKKFHAYARECLQLAEQATDPDTKGAWLNCRTSGWRNFALREERHITTRTRPQIGQRDNSGPPITATPVVLSVAEQVIGLSR